MTGAVSNMSVQGIINVWGYHAEGVAASSAIGTRTLCRHLALTATVAAKQDGFFVLPSSLGTGQNPVV